MLDAAKEGPAVSRAVRSKAGNITLGEAKVREHGIIGNSRQSDRFPQQILHLQDAEKITLEDVIKVRREQFFGGVVTDSRIALATRSLVCCKCAREGRVPVLAV